MKFMPRFTGKANRIVVIFILMTLILTGFVPMVPAEEEEMDSDHDGWSDEYERIMGTDPNNPDTDGDGIEDPDDPTPKGSLINEEEIWETFDVTVSTDHRFSTVDQDLEITVHVEKNGVPIAGRSIWLFIYFEDLETNDFNLISERSSFLADGNAVFGFEPDDFGNYYFLAVVNRSIVSPGNRISYDEIYQVVGKKQGGMKEYRVYPLYDATISSHLNHILSGQTASFTIRKWEFSEEKADAYEGNYPSREDLYEPISGNVQVSFGDGDQEIEGLELFVSSDGSNWSYTFTGGSYYGVAVSAYDIVSYWTQGPGKFPYDYESIRVHDPLVDWLDVPDHGKVLEAGTFTAHRVYLDPAMGADLFNELYSKHSMEWIARNYPEYTIPWTGTAWISILYGEYDYYITLQQASVSVDGTGPLNYTFDIPGGYMATLSFSGKPAYPTNVRFDFYPYQGSYTSLADHHERFRVSSDIIPNVFAEDDVFFTGESCTATISCMNGGSNSNAFPIALYREEQYLTTIELPVSGIDHYQINDLSRGDHRISALPLFSDRTKWIAETMGLDNYELSDEIWIGHADIYVRNIAIYTHLPYYFVRGYDSPLQILAYESGFQPVENATVTVKLVDKDYGYHYSTLTIATGTTDESGAFSPIITIPGNDYYDHISIKVETDGISEIIEYGIYIRSENIDCQFTLNKPMYRGGDVIHASFLIWNADRVEPVQTDGLARLIDPYDRTILRSDISTNEYGQGSVDFQLADKLPWGRYKLTVEIQGNTFQRYFDIEEYDLPETTIFFEDAPSESTPGENITIPLRAEYLFGASVTEGTVEFTISGYHPISYYYPWYFYDYYDSVVYRSDDGSGTRSEPLGYSLVYSDPEGFPITQEVEVKNGWANLTFRIPDNANDMIIRADFSDRFGHENSASHILGTGSSNLGTTIEVSLQKERYLPDEKVTCEITVMKDEEPLSGTDLNISILAEGLDQEEEVFYLTGKTDDFGIFGFDVQDTIPYTRLLRDELYYYTITARLDDDHTRYGTNNFLVQRIKGTITTDKTDYVPEDIISMNFGEYDLLEDNWGYTNFSLEISYQSPGMDTYSVQYHSLVVMAFSGVLENEEGSFDFTLPQYMPEGRYLIAATFDRTEVHHNIQVYTRDQRIEINSLQDEYAAGDTLDVHITTYDSEGKWVYVDVITGRSMTSYAILPEHEEFDLSIPTQDYRHAIEVRAYIISDNGVIASDYLSFSQDLPDIILNTTTDKDTYEPGEKATLNITITDSNGDPVPQCLVLVSIVDSAVFELEPDTDENGFLSDFRSPWEQERYYQLRANYHYVTWYPTDLEATSEVFWPVDSSRGAIYDDSEDYYKYADGAELNGAADAQYDMAMPGYLDLGGELQEVLDTTDVRSDFRDTAFWLAGMDLENGTWSWEIDLPDDLARWQVKIMAVTMDCLGSMETIEFNTSKDFFVDIVIPHRVIQDDEFTLVTRVHNFLNEDLEISIGLTADEWLMVFGPNEKDMVLEAMSVEEVEFRVKVIENGLNNLTLIATDFGNNTDAVQRNMDVRPNGALKTSHLTGSVEDSVTEEISFLPELVEGSEQAVLRLAVGYEGLLEEGARMLGGYPYGCTEQIMSVLLPNVLLYENYDIQGQLTSHSRYLYQMNIYKGVMKLLDNQHDSGGWGWWKGDSTDNYMTAYVLFGLSKIKDIGLYISEDIIDSARDSLMERMNDDGIWAPADWMGDNEILMTIYVSYALAVSGYSSTQLTKSMDSLEDAWNDGDVDDPYELALYSLLLLELGLDASAVLEKLEDSITVSHWQAGSSLGGGDETTAWAAYAFTVAGTRKELVRGSLEWLSDQRLPGGGWGTTSDTIAALILINEVIKTSEKPDMDVTVKLNGETLISMHVDHTYQSQHEFRSALDALQLTGKLDPEGSNSISIEKSGTGDLFYELTTIQYLRKGIDIEYDEHVDVEKNDRFSIHVNITAEPSDNVDIASLGVTMPEQESPVLVSYEKQGTDNGFSSYVFSYLADLEGEYTIGPFVVSYSLESGERKSAMIREYFTGTTILVSGGEARSRGAPAEVNEAGYRSDEDNQVNDRSRIIKILTGSPVVLGESVEVKVIATISEEHMDETIRIVDTIPDGFTASGLSAEPVNGEIIMEFSGESVMEFTYTLEPTRLYSGTLPRALLYLENDLIGYSNLPALTTISNDDIAMERILSTSTPMQNQVVSVSLHLRAPDGLDYAAVEDALPPGATVLEDSVAGNLDDNVLSYAITGDKVVFFIRLVEELTLTYQYVPMITGSFALLPAEMYSMYEIGTRTESGSGYMVISEPDDNNGDALLNIDLAISIDEEEIPDDLTEGMEIEFIVTVYNLWSNNLDSVPISLYVDDVLIWRDSVQLPFYSGTRVRVPWTAVDGDHSIRIAVDDIDMIEEANEENNEVTFDIHVKDKKTGMTLATVLVLAFMGGMMIAVVALTYYLGRGTGKGYSAFTRFGWKDPGKILKNYRHWVKKKEN